MCQNTVDLNAMRAAPDSRTKGSFSQIPVDDEDDLEDPQLAGGLDTRTGTGGDGDEGPSILKCTALPGSPPLLTLLKYIAVGTAVGVVVGSTGSSLFSSSSNDGQNTATAGLVGLRDPGASRDSLWAAPSVYNTETADEESTYPLPDKIDSIPEEEDVSFPLPDRTDPIPFTPKGEGADTTTKKITFPLPDKVDPVPLIPNVHSYDAQDEIGIHYQCAHVSEERFVKNRPMLLFKYA